MGPLVPDIISGEFNYIIALILGIGFGYALEQAGFASTKKLVGLFYGNDFTVLRVFFTAGITAAVGVIVLNHLGLLNVNIIFINPTYLWAALIGGTIMGAGFIIGGFCPGTSACAAATGRLDGWSFIIGSIIGIFAFTEGYPFFKDLYYADYQGELLINEMMGLSRESFGLLMVFIGILAFVATQKIEDIVNKRKNKWSSASIRKFTLISSIPVLIILIVMITPNKMEVMNQRIDTKIAAGECKPLLIDGDKLAYELMNNYYLYNVIDVRSKVEFDKFHIPTAINIPLDELFTIENQQLYLQNIKTNIFYADTDIHAKKACMISRYLGNSDNYALNISAAQFEENFFKPETKTIPKSKSEDIIYNFRLDAGKKLLEIQEAVLKMNKPLIKKEKRVAGGCS